MSSKHSYFLVSGSGWTKFLFQVGAVVSLGMSSAASAQPPDRPLVAESSAVPDSAEPEGEPSTASDDAASVPDSAEPDSTEPPSDVPASDAPISTDPAVQETEDDGSTTAPAETSEETVTQGTSTAGAEERSASDEEGWMKLDASSAKLEEKPASPKPFFRTMLLIEGAARYGAVTIAPPGTTLEEEDPDAFESSVGNLGGQLTLGVMPGGGAFTMAGRLRGGSYLSEDFTRGNVAAEMLFGASFGRNARGNEFTYVLGGFGVEFLPGENQDMLTLSVGAATVVKGVSFGGGLFLGANDEIAIGTIGMQIGWGQLF